MFGIMKRWKNQVLVEGEKEANLVAREEGYRTNVDPNFDMYPVDVDLPKKRSLWQAMKKSLKYSEMGIYNIIYKCK